MPEIDIPPSKNCPYALCKMAGSGCMAIAQVKAAKSLAEVSSTVEVLGGCPYNETELRQEANEAKKRLRGES